MKRGSVVYEYHESGMENDKEDSVYVLADPDGTPNEITVNVSLKNKGLDQKLTDETFLTGLKNKEGDEEVTDLGGGRYEWENHGEDIHYEGTAEASATLPVSVKMRITSMIKRLNRNLLPGQTERSPCILIIRIRPKR